MAILIFTSIAHWSHIGHAQLKENWNAGLLRGGNSVQEILKQVYYGFCLGMLGLTGFECELHPTFLTVAFLVFSLPSDQVHRRISRVSEMEGFRMYYGICIYPRLL